MKAAWSFPPRLHRTETQNENASYRQRRGYQHDGRRDDFRYLEEMSWDDEGYYEAVYHTADSAGVEINIDPLSGETVEQR